MSLAGRFGDAFLQTLTTVQVTLYWAVDLPRRLLFKVVIAASAVLAVGSEFLQAALPNGRIFDPVDIAANFLGSALAIAGCTWYHKRMLERKRQRKLQGYGLVEGGEADGDVELGESSHQGQELGVIAEDDDDGAEAWDDIGEGSNTEDDGHKDLKPKD